MLECTTLPNHNAIELLLLKFIFPDCALVDVFITCTICWQSISAIRIHEEDKAAARGELCQYIIAPLTEQVRGVPLHLASGFTEAILRDETIVAPNKS